MVAVRSAEQRLEVARIRLNNAMIERKTQEKLKEKAWESYLLEFDAEERKIAEEITGFNYSSNPGREDA
jgi:flagellar FliJ protein